MIMADQLVDFLRNRKERAALPETDWEARQVAWVDSVKSLYELERQMPDTVTLLRNPDTTRSRWAVVVQRIPHLKTMPLDSETLKYTFERVMLA